MWISVFKTGTHTDAAGNTRQWTREDLDAIVKNYDPTKYEAPAVIGHPETNSPAWAWMESLKREGDLLWAKMKDVVPEFAEMLKKKMFKNRSISLYPDLRLRHVGFLGATPPAVKGLPDFKFNDELNVLVYEFAATDAEKAAQEKRSKKYNIGIKEGGSITKPSKWADVNDDDFLDPVNYSYPCPSADQTRAAARYWGRPDNKKLYTAAEQKIIDGRLDDKMKQFKLGDYANHSEYQVSIISNILQRMREFLIEKFGMDTADKVVGGYEIDALKVTDASVTDETDNSFSQNKMEPIMDANEIQKELDAKKAEITEFSKNLKALEVKNAEMKAALEKVEAEKRNAEFTAFTDGLIKDGKLLPAQKENVIALMEAMSGREEYEFADGSKKDLLVEFRSMLEKSGKMIEFDEIAKKGKASASSAAGTKMEQIVSEKLKENKKLSYSDAFAEAQKENPELADAYLGELS